MVVIRKRLAIAILPVVIGPLLLLNGCKDEEDATTLPSKTDLLIGDWQITEVDGNDWSNNDYYYLFKFKITGDWQFCYDYPADPSQNYCYSSAKWEWLNSDEETIIINNFLDDSSGKEEWTLDVVIMDETNLEGALSVEYYNSDAFPIKFIKIK